MLVHLRVDRILDGLSGLERNLAQNHVAVHGEVTQQAVKRVLECCGAVLLEEEMARPGKAVSGQWQHQQQQPRPFADGEGQDENHQGGADEVQSSAGAVAVFAKVIRVELSEAIEMPGVFHGYGLDGSGSGERMLCGELI